MTRVIANKKDIYYTFEELRKRGFWTNITDTSLAPVMKNFTPNNGRDEIANSIQNWFDEYSLSDIGDYIPILDFRSEVSKKADRDYKYRLQKEKEQDEYYRRLALHDQEAKNEYYRRMIAKRDAKVRMMEEEKALKQRLEEGAWTDQPHLFSNELALPRIEKMDLSISYPILYVHNHFLPVIARNFLRHRLGSLLNWLGNNYKDIFTGVYNPIMKEFLEIFPIHLSEITNVNERQIVSWVVTRASQSREKLRYLNQTAKALGSVYTPVYYNRTKDVFYLTSPPRD